MDWLAFSDGWKLESSCACAGTTPIDYIDWFLFFTGIIFHQCKSGSSLRDTAIQDHDLPFHTSQCSMHLSVLAIAKLKYSNIQQYQSMRHAK